MNTDHNLQLFKCLADASRLQILAGLVREPMYVELISERLALSPSTVSFHLKKLEAAGLVTSKKEQYYTIYSIVPGMLDKPLRNYLHQDDAKLDIEAEREAAYRAKVIDSFFRYGKLKTIPAQRKKRVIVLEEIAKKFSVGQEYTEKEVNLAISDVHDDFCTLRRDLVDEGIMKRDHGVYWLNDNQK